MPERMQHGVHARPVLAAFAVFAVTLLVIGGIVRALAVRWDAAEGPHAPPAVQIAGPELQSAPQYARDRHDAEKLERLESYAWVDRNRGIARIPIEAAMQAIVERGHLRNTEKTERENSARTTTEEGRR